jgi:hypothetical protein
MVLGTAQASAQVVQSVQVGVGAFFPRGVDTRVAGDTIVANLNDQNPLAFEFGKLTSGQISGEWNVSFGHHLEVSAGIGIYQDTIPSVYRDLVNVDQTEIVQHLKLRITPITGIVRFLAGRQGGVQPYFGVGICGCNFRYSEYGQFVDPSDYSVYSAQYTTTGTPVGPIVLGGVRFPVKGDIYGFTTEYRYQFVTANTGGIANGFLGPKIDLSGGTLNFAFLVRF